jgi:hypothetical protein
MRINVLAVAACALTVAVAPAFLGAGKRGHRGAASLRYKSALQMQLRIIISCVAALLEGTSRVPMSAFAKTAPAACHAVVELIDVEPPIPFLTLRNFDARCKARR